MYRHESLCDCKEGFVGDGYQGCFELPTAKSGSGGRSPGTKACDVVTCGSRATCVLTSGQPSCVCEEGYFGKPPNCQSKSASGGVACRSDEFCPFDSVCVSGVCTDPCLLDRICGVGATCTVRQHAVACSCPFGYQGDPSVICQPVPLTITTAALAAAPIPFGARCPFSLCSGSANSTRRNSGNRTRPRPRPPTSNQYELVLS
jgi:hypothetical protein